MKILLDNCVHYRAKDLFPGHEVLHARDMDWRALSNGMLLAESAKHFDVLATTDKNIRREHNLASMPISVLELNSKFTRIDDLRMLTPYLETALAACATHRFVSVRADGMIEKLGAIQQDE